MEEMSNLYKVYQVVCNSMAYDVWTMEMALTNLTMLDSAYQKLFSLDFSEHRWRDFYNYVKSRLIVDFRNCRAKLVNFKKNGG